MTVARPGSKPEVFADRLRDGRVCIHLDARRPGVVLPPNLRSQKHLALDYGRNLSIPVEDVEVDGWGIRATLSFERETSITFVTWAAIYAITDEHGIWTIWVDDLPDDIEFRRETQPTEREVKWIH